MILIITEQNDFSTCKVIDWLDHHGVEWMRLNERDIVGVSYHLFPEGSTTMILNTVYNTIQMNELKGVWYRRGSLNFQIGEALSSIVPKIKQHLSYEWETLKSCIEEKLEGLPAVGKLSTGDNLNRLKVLQKATEVGLKVPETIVTDSIADLLVFKQQHKRIITKGIQRNPSFQRGDSGYFSFTKEVSDKMISECPEEFFPSLFQVFYPKQYELRIFYLDGGCYAMAQFPNSETSQIDIRNTQSNKPRGVPYRMPFEVENKVVRLMDVLGLNCGSIDMIVPQEDEFIFLEVNAIGQYDYLSVKCNYGLDERIAERLRGY